MGNREQHKVDLAALFEAFFQSGDDQFLRAYIQQNSNLPGPRGNLELAAALAAITVQFKGKDHPAAWSFFASLAGISAEEGPINSAAEFLPFCGVTGAGALAANVVEYLPEALVIIRRAANDTRWRMREAVAATLLRLALAHPEPVLAELETWVAGDSLLEWRAVAAGVADPALGKNSRLAQWALIQHRQILNRLLQVQNRRTEEFTTLRQALGYTLSLVVQVLPAEGFALMAELIRRQDKDALWIVKENLKKNRLIRRYPQEIEALKKQLA